MHFNYHLPISKFCGYPLHELPRPLNLQDYQSALHRILSNLDIPDTAEIVMLRQKLMQQPFSTLRIIDWKTDKLNASFLTTDSHKESIKNIHQLFADLHFLELTIHHLTTFWLNRDDIWLHIGTPLQDYWKTIYSELQAFLIDIQHLHCHLTRLLCQDPDLPVWSSASNQLKIVPQDNWFKEYIYQSDCYSPTELREMFDQFMEHCKFTEISETLKNSYFFQSQILKLLSKPVSIHLIKKLICELKKGKKIFLELDKIYGAIGEPSSKGTFDHDGHPYKIIRGIPGINVTLGIVFSGSKLYESYIRKLFSFAGQDRDCYAKKIQIFQLPIFVVIAHELRHLLNYLKGKSAPYNTDAKDWQDIFELYSNFEEYRTICYSTCCEQAILADFDLPLRISHAATDSFAEAIEKIKKATLRLLLKRNNLRAQFSIRKTPEQILQSTKLNSVVARPVMKFDFNPSSNPDTSMPISVSTKSAFRKI